MNKRIKLYYILMIIFAFSIFFLLGEAFIRTSGIGSPSKVVLIDNAIIKFKPFIKYINRSERLNLVKHNNWGFHDHNRDIDNNKYRILFLGDSYVEGIQVPVDSLFTSILEKKFRQEGRAIEVINAGVSRFGTSYEYQLWKKFFYNKIRIDHIVVCIFIGNDLKDNNSLLTYPPINYGVYLDSIGNIDVKSVKYSIPQSIARYLARHSALVNFIYSKLHYLKRSFLKKRIKRIVHAQTNFYDSAWNESVNGTIRLIERWNKEASNERIKFSIILIIPGSFYVEGGYKNAFEDMFVKKLKKLCLNKKIHFLELDFTDYDPYEIYSFDGVTLGHFNFLGHQLVADKIFLWLKRNIFLVELENVY